MASNLGSLVVSLGLDAAEFVAGLTKAQYETQRAVQQISRTMEGAAVAARNIGAALGVGLSVAGIVAWSRSVIEAAENLRKLSIETGSTVEDLSRLSNIAKISGTDFDTFRQTLDRLAAGIGGAETKGTRVAEVLKLLGINAKDPATALEQLATQLNRYADDASKAALLQSAFRLSGVQLATMFKEIADNSGVAATKTTEQARAATELAEKLRTLQIESHTLADILLNELAPGLTKVVTAITEAAKLKGGLFAGLGLVAGISPFASLDQNISDTEKQIDDINKSIEGVKAASGGLWAKIAPSSQDTSNLEATKKNLEDQLKLLQTLKGQSLGNLDYLNKDRRPPAPQLPPKGLEKATLEAQLAVIDAFIKSEQELLKQREKFLDDYFRTDELSIADWARGKQDALEAATKAEITALDKEATLIRAAAARALPTERATEEKKLIDVLARRAAVEQNASYQSIANYRAEIAAVKEFRRSVEEIVVSVTALRGDTVGAAALGFDLQNEQLLKKIALEKQSGDENIRNLAIIGDRYIQELRQRTIEQAALNDALLKYNNELAGLGIAQSRVDLAAQTGSITEIAALNQKADLARKFIPILTAQAEEYRKIAEAAAPGPLKDAALIQVERLKLEIDQLAVATEALNNKFRDLFESNFANALTDFVTGAKTAKQAFNDLVKGITRDLASIASKNVAEQLFGKGGALGGIPEFFGKAFGGGGAFGGGSAGIAALGTASSASATAVSLLAPSATAAAAALDAVAASGVFGGGASGLGNIFGGSGTDQGLGALAGGIFAGAASGGYISGPTLVGERGPELFLPSSSGVVIPNDVLAGRRNQKQANISTYITIAGNTDTRTAAQVARETGLAVRRELHASGLGR